MLRPALPWSTLAPRPAAARASAIGGCRRGMAPKAAHLRAAVATSCALAAAAFAAKQWADFGEELRAHLRQAPACCLDGRPASAGVAEARFQVDDFQHDLDAAYGSLNCRFQVHPKGGCARSLVGMAGLRMGERDAEPQAR